MVAAVGAAVGAGIFSLGGASGFVSGLQIGESDIWRQRNKYGGENVFSHLDVSVGTKLRVGASGPNPA